MLRNRGSIELTAGERMTLEEMVRAYSISSHKDLTINNIRHFVEALLDESYNMGREDIVTEGYADAEFEKTVYDRYYNSI